MSIKNGYHYNDRERKYFRFENGNKIPEYVCLCFAHEYSDCVCDCTNWDEIRSKDYDYEDY